MADFSLDYFGRVQGFCCHDAIFNFLDAREKEVLKIGFRDVDGIQKILRIEGVKSLFVGDFREGNIIDSFYLWSIYLVPKNIENLISKSNFRDVLKSSASEDKKKSLLFFLECSFGAELCAIIEPDMDINQYLSCGIQLTLGNNSEGNNSDTHF